MSPVYLRRLLLPVLLLAILLIVTGQAQPAHAACTPGTVLCDRFGVELTLQPSPITGYSPSSYSGGQAPTTAGPYNGYAFNWSSLAPTKNTDTVDWKEGDWFGRWELDNINFTSSLNRDIPSTARTLWDYWASGDEPYDVEALYFDNDAENVYVAIITSVPPYAFVGGGVQGWGVYESRPPFSPTNGFWIPGSDLAISLMKGTPRTERNSQNWYYNYGLNIAHENRDAPFNAVVAGSTYYSAQARDYSLGTDFWKTNTDICGVSQANDNPKVNPSAPACTNGSDWFTAVGTGAAYAHGEHTNFDPLSVNNMVAYGGSAMEFRGNVPVLNYYEYQFPGGLLENDAPTYVIEAVIPRSFFGADNPKNGDPIGLRFSPSCRNDGNDGEDNANELVTGQDDPVLKLFGDFDDKDWGDAPDGPYPTTKASSGANHALLNNAPFMGARVDAENDGQPNVTATGDDINPASADDEDGVSFISSLIPTTVATIQVDMTGAPAATQCTLSSWIDFNAVNAWNDPGDLLSYLTCPTCTAFVPGPNPVLPAGAVHTLTFTVPAGATSGVTYARFRCTTTGALPPTGSAPNGEVEDYQVVVGPAPSRDWGDAPDTYGTLFSSNGPYHGLVAGGPVLGAIVDPEANGQPSPLANGDDVNPASADDEDGVTLPGSVTAAVPGVMTVQVSTAACYLTGWIDFDVNGAFDPAEQLNISSCVGCTSGVPGTAPLLPVGGPATLTFDVPVGAAPGASYARFRCAIAAVNTPLGGAPDGEVEDYPITIVNTAVDWGDLPATAPGTAFPTLAAANGPRHVLSSNLYLGQCVDAEGNGVPSAQANGDDGASGTVPAGFPACTTAGDDEDGVTLVTPLIAGNQACVRVTANNTAAGVLQGWIDFDGSGTFDASEALGLTGGGVVASGVVNQNYCFNVPATATFTGGQAYMRFRLSSAGGLSWTGAAPNGEVEDYWQPLACVGNFVWYDADNDGIQDEPGSNGIDGVQVTLTWFGPNGVLGGGDDVVYSTLTAQVGAVNGRYQFCGLTPTMGAVAGTYRLDIPNPPYTLATLANSGSTTDFLDSDGTQPGGPSSAVTSPAFTINPATGLPTGENGPGDQVGAGTTGIGFSGFPNNQDNMSIDFGFTGSPLSVLLAGFDAAAQTDHVLVAWETVSEASNSGFNLYRSLSADGEYALLGFTPSASPGSTAGAAYSYQDFTVAAGQTYWYKLEDVDLNGAATLHGPVSVAFQAPTAVELDTLAASGGAGALALPGLLAALLAAGAAALLVDRRRRNTA